jgi:hypothetical protein
MRKLVVMEYTSLDGVIQAPGHPAEDPEGGFAHGGWTGPLMSDHQRYNSESFQTAGAFLLGRLTYDIRAALLADRHRRERPDRPRPQHTAEVRRLAHARRYGLVGDDRDPRRPPPGARAEATARQTDPAIHQLVVRPETVVSHEQDPERSILIVVESMSS